MTLIKSIAGMRGTIGGKEGESLSPNDIVKIVSAYATWISSTDKAKVIIGRDSRISGPMVTHLVIGTLMAKGVDVIDLGMATTPTVEMAVTDFKAKGGIIISASHNPRNWNALKLLNEKGEFISDADGKRILMFAESKLDYCDVDSIGKCSVVEDYLLEHIKAIIKHPLVDKQAIKNAKLKIAVDAVNSIGGEAVPALLKALEVGDIVEINCTPDGEFAHNPEPLPENITEISKAIVTNNLDLGIVVDPDVDRLALVCNNGEPFGEDFTLVAVADYYLQNKKTPIVANLSSTMALYDIAAKHGVNYFEAAVGEVNVVAEMKKQHSEIGGEGNGGIIFPALHYGRDALVGIALFLSFLAKEKTTISELRDRYPKYKMIKDKIQLEGIDDLDRILEKIGGNYSEFRSSTIDGLKIYFEKSWVHLRKSNTEPIIRIYAEAINFKEAQQLADAIKKEINELQISLT